MSKSTPGMGLVLGWGQDIVVLPLKWASNSDMSKHLSAPMSASLRPGRGWRKCTLSLSVITKQQRRGGEKRREREGKRKGGKGEEEEKKREGEGKKEGEHRWRTGEEKKRKGGEWGERTNQVLCLMPWKTYIQQNLCSDLQLIIFVHLFTKYVFLSLYPQG